MHSGDTDSEDCFSDESKRKREFEDINRIFKKSRKIVRSPPSTSTSSGMEELKAMMIELLKEMKEIRSENQEFRESIMEMKKENEHLKEVVKILEGKVCKMDILESRMEKSEKEKRRNNIIINGLLLKDKNNMEVAIGIEDFLYQQLQIRTKINKAIKFNDRVCMVELENFEKKMEIMKSKAKLKNTTFSKIYIDNDYTENEMRIQKEIRLRAETEKKMKKTVKVKYQKLEIDNVMWVWNHTEGKLMEQSKND